MVRRRQHSIQKEHSRTLESKEEDLNRHGSVGVGGVRRLPRHGYPDVAYPVLFLVLHILLLPQLFFQYHTSFHTVRSCCLWSLILARTLERRSRFGSIGLFHTVFALRCFLSDVNHGWIILVSTDPRPPTRFGPHLSNCFCVAAGYGKSNHQSDVGQRHDCL